VTGRHAAIPLLVAALFAACESPSTSAPDVPDGSIPSVDAGADVTSIESDAGAEAGPTFDAALPEPLLTLSQTGLYEDIVTKTISS